MASRALWLVAGTLSWLGCSDATPGAPASMAGAAGTAGSTTAGTGASQGGGGASAGSGGVAGSGQSQAGSATGGTAGTGGSAGGTGGSGGAAPDPGPEVDRTDPQLYHFKFTAKEADPTATVLLVTQNAYLDTNVEPLGKLVVYLHGAGVPTDCGGGALAELVAGFGYHWFAPCYSSNYGIGNCGDDIGGCRLEAFEGKDHHDFVDIGRSDSIEGRVVAGLKRLATQNPEGDWGYFLAGDQPRWSKIVIAGSSHGASSAGLIGMYRAVSRVIMHAGPLDLDQAWLEQTPVTPIASYFAFSHTADEQHTGHLAAFATMGVPGAPTSVDGATPPYAQSHRLISSRTTGNGHGAVSDAKIEDYQPVFEYLYLKAP